jgi:thioredoxin-like negative regulator of GroEL
MNGRAGKALEALERAASALSATSETKALYGRALALAGQLEAAEQVFEQAASATRWTRPRSAALHVAEQLGHTTSRVPRSSNTCRSARRPRRSRERRADRHALARAARRAGALPWLQRALADNPQDVGVLSAMADAQLQTGDPAAAR